MSGDEEIAPSTARLLLAEVARTQREGRLPSLVAGVTRGGQLLWSGGRGTVDDAVPGIGTQYRIGSITKPMTAVLVLRLRDEGRLGLDDPIGKHLPGLPFGERTIGQLLTHAAGLRAELPGEWWERVPGMPWDEFVAGLSRQDVLFPAGRRYHYSNMGYAVLGELVAQLRGRPWFEVLNDEVLKPLGMERTSYGPQPGAAKGWAVHPWADLVLPEPAEDLGAGAAAGQLWSSVEDLGRFAGLLLGRTSVVSSSTLAEMTTPASGYGLGMTVLERAGGVVLGHGGSVPGYVAGLFVDPAQQTGVVVMANATNGRDLGALTFRLLDLMRRHEPYPGPVWRPLEEADPEALAMTGTWYWGPSGVGVRLQGDGELAFAGLGTSARASRFRRDTKGEWIGLDDYYAGERLRPVRDAEGNVTSLDVGGFVFTREPYEASGPIPGGVDPGGWR